jgi:VWFA-related protein
VDLTRATVTHGFSAIATVLAAAILAGSPLLFSQPIRTSVDYVSTDLVVRDSRGRFLADLKKEEIEIFEDGVRQQLASLTLTHGGRAIDIAAPPPPPAVEGVILPPVRPTNDAAGRIFLIFVDDLHLDFTDTGKIRQLFTTISEELIHEGDLFGILSTGPSSIQVDLTYDRAQLKEAMTKIAGGALKPQEIVDAPQGAQGPAEVRHRAHVAFSTAYDLMKSLEQVRNRRKAFIYVSNGYDFDPFSQSRLKQEREQYGRPGGAEPDAVNPFSRQGNQFSQTDLVAELAELTRAANRANATIYTIDPRGLVGGPDISQQVDPTDWQNHLRSTQDSLRTLAELTGGIPVVNSNDFRKALKRIDQETSDYYVVGYYSSNPDQTKRRRQIEIRIKRAGVSVQHRTSYTLRPR